MDIYNLGAFLTVIYPNNASVPWWLSGGIPAVNCIAAFQPKGAADLAASYANLASGGATWDAAAGDAPTFAAETGWTFNGVNNYLVVGIGAIFSAPPFSLVCRFKSTTVASLQFLLAIADTDGANIQFGLDANGAQAGDPVRMAAMIGGVSAASTTSGFTANTAYTAAGVTAAANSRAAYIDGGSKGTSSENRVPTNLDVTTIGARISGGSPSYYLSGVIVACAFYDVALTDEQVAALHTAMAAL